MFEADDDKVEVDCTKEIVYDDPFVNEDKVNILLLVSMAALGKVIVVLADVLAVWLVKVYVYAVIV